MIIHIELLLVVNAWAQWTLCFSRHACPTCTRLAVTFEVTSNVSVHLMYYQHVILWI